MNGTIFSQHTKVRRNDLVLHHNIPRFSGYSLCLSPSITSGTRRSRVRVLAVLFLFHQRRLLTAVPGDEDVVISCEWVPIREEAAFCPPT